MPWAWPRTQQPPSGCCSRAVCPGCGAAMWAAGHWSSCVLTGTMPCCCTGQEAGSSRGSAQAGAGQLWPEAAAAYAGHPAGACQPADPSRGANGRQSSSGVDSSSTCCSGGGDGGGVEQRIGQRSSRENGRQCLTGGTNRLCQPTFTSRPFSTARGPAGNRPRTPTEAVCAMREPVT